MEDETKMTTRVWFVALDEDSYDVDDGVWAHEGQFFSCETKANQVCYNLNKDELKRWRAAKEDHYARWELTNIAYDAMTKIGMDVKKVFPYHHYNDFRHPEFKDVYVVRSIEVQ
jgi:hypothetical protein